jgi:hypothetical protein
MVAIRDTILILVIPVIPAIQEWGGIRFRAGTAPALMALMAVD